MGAVAERRVSYADYLALEARSEGRHEFVGGAVLAMAGGTIEHGRIIARLVVSQRERRVEVYRRTGPRRWSLDEHGAGEAVTLTSIEATFAVDDVYSDALGSIVD